MNKKSFLNNVVISILLSLAYFGCFFSLYFFFKTPSLVHLSILFIGFVSWNRGIVPGLLIVVINFFWTAFTISIVTPEISGTIPPDAFFSFLLHAVIAVISGVIARLTNRLQMEIEERKKTEKLLKAYQGELEKRVETRTNELAKMNERLHQAEKMEAIGQLAGGISHDLKNYLTITLGYSDLLLKNIDETSNAYDYAERVRKSIKETAGLTKQLLAFARKEKFVLQQIDINKLVSETLTFIPTCLNKKITVRKIDAHSLPWINGGRTQIQNALVNLILNAQDAMEEGGGVLSIITEKIEVNETFRNRKAIECAPGTYVGITVADTGPGIEPEVIKHVFEPFFTTKQSGKGTGMGLAAVYGIVQSHNGAVYVTSEAEKGAAFTMLFPVDQTLEN